MRRVGMVMAMLCIFSVTALRAQESFSNTMTLSAGEESPDATLEDIAWIQGHWRGKAFGGITEEFWTPPLGGSMMCAYKLVVDGNVDFYEIVTISEIKNSLILRLKHFHNDLKGWEEKDETVDFPLVKVSDNKMFFDGFTFEKVSDNEMNVYVIIGTDDGKKEMKFNYNRVR